LSGRLGTVSSRANSFATGCGNYLGRYAVSDRLFRRYLELQTCEP
jgi:hypothetical protein